MAVNHRFFVVFYFGNVFHGSLLINDCNVYELVRVLETLAVVHGIDKFTVTCDDSDHMLRFRKSSLLKGFDFSELFQFV